MVFQHFCTFNMWQLNVQFGQNLNSFWQNWFKFHQKSLKKRHRIQSWFRELMFFDFSLLPRRFWINFGSRMGEVLLLKAVSKAFPSPSWTPKAIWSSIGTILEAIWKHFWMIFDQIWSESFSINSIKGRYVQLYRPYFAARAPLTFFRPIALPCRGYWWEHRWGNRRGPAGWCIAALAREGCWQEAVPSKR